MFKRRFKTVLSEHLPRPVIFYNQPDRRMFDQDVHRRTIWNWPAGTWLKSTLQEQRLLRAGLTGESKLKPYRFSFIASGTRHTWIRFYRDMETALLDCKAAAKREYSDTSGFLIESDQGDANIRKSWGLNF